MLSEFYANGWNHSGTVEMMPGGTGIFMTLEHTHYPNITLDIQVSLDEIPAITVVSLVEGMAIEHEWQDEEIHVTEITATAERLSREVEEECLQCLV